MQRVLSRRRDTDGIGARACDFLNIITPGPPGRTLILSESDRLRRALMLMKMDRETEREGEKERKARRDERVVGMGVGGGVFERLKVAG